MSRRVAVALSALALALRAHGAFADEPPKEAAPAKPAPRPQPSARAPKPPPAPALPEPELHARLIAPSAAGPWTLRLENEGTHWVRVPADLRLLHITVESGDTVSRKIDKPLKCELPGALRMNAFPEPNALLLGPGDAYVESFDPRLFCFGKEAKTLAGGALVRATYGFDGPANARKLEAPYVVEGTTYPAAVEPKKLLVVPSLVLSYQPPELELEHPEHFEHHEPPEAEHPEPPPLADRPPEPRPPIDENAPRLEVTTAAFADAGNGRAVTVSVTVTNTGHRTGTAAIRPRMLSFRVDGPDGAYECPHEPRMNVPREAYSTLKPGGATSMSVLIVEACGRELFPRPGLYRVTPTLHLKETGAAYGLVAMTGELRARDPLLVRIAAGPDPFYKHAPQALRASEP